LLTRGCRLPLQTPEPTVGHYGLVTPCITYPLAEFLHCITED
jgi:hypothetical protein